MNILFFKIDFFSLFLVCLFFPFFLKSLQKKRWQKKNKRKKRLDVQEVKSIPKLFLRLVSQLSKAAFNSVSGSFRGLKPGSSISNSACGVREAKAL